MYKTNTYKMSSYQELYYKAYTPQELLDFVEKCSRDIERIYRRLDIDKSTPIDPDNTHDERAICIINTLKSKAIEKLINIIK
jgi:hypothetical protein